MAVNINVPSQVKTYANLAAFPATGALKTIYIAEDTNKTYRWTGSVYTEISASAAMTWGAIGGTLSAQTDLQSALDAKVPTSRTLTINGVTQDLSANRTFTISTGITIGSTAITSGTVGRVLFEGAGNVVQESANLFWDNTNGRLGIGTSAPAYNLDVNGSSRFQNNVDVILRGADISWDSKILNNYQWFFKAGIYTDYINFGFGSGTALRIQQNGNVLIGTTTDAGFRLDVNGTLRSLGFTLRTSTADHYATAFSTTSTDGTFNFRRGADNGWVRFTLGASSQFFMSGETGTGELRVGAASGHFLTLYSGGSERIRLFNSTGNVGINTTTDAGFRLDVNGTARFQSDVTVANSLMKMYVTGGVIRFEQQGGAGIPIAFMQNGSFYQYIDQATLNIAFRNDYSFVMTTGNTSTINASAKMQIDSTTRGFLPPRMTTTQKNAIASPAAGLMVYDTTLNVISYYNGSMWI